MAQTPGQATAKKKSVRRRVGSSRSARNERRSCWIPVDCEIWRKPVCAISLETQIIIRLRLGAKITNVTSLKSCLTSWPVCFRLRAGHNHEGIKKLTAPKISFDFSRALNIHESGFTTSKKNFFSLFFCGWWKKLLETQNFSQPDFFFCRLAWTIGRCGPQKQSDTALPHSQTSDVALGLPLAASEDNTIN